MFNCCKEWAISFIIFNINIQLKGLYHMLDNFKISSCDSKMKGNFTFGLFELIQHLFQRNILAVDFFLFTVDFLFQINEEKFQLSNLECCDCVDDLLESCHNLLILFEVFTVHFSILYWKIFIYKSVFQQFIIFLIIDLLITKETILRKL